MRRMKDILKYLPPLGRHAYLDEHAIKRLVQKLQLGLHVSGHVERRREGWRLRVSVTNSKGVRVRRGITLPDTETAFWVKAYIEKAKEKRRIACATRTQHDDSAC